MQRKEKFVEVPLPDLALLTATAHEIENRELGPAISILVRQALALSVPWSSISTLLDVAAIHARYALPEWIAPIMPLGGGQLALRTVFEREHGLEDRAWWALAATYGEDEAAKAVSRAYTRNAQWKAESVDNQSVMVIAIPSEPGPDLGPDNPAPPPQSVMQG